MEAFRAKGYEVLLLTAPVDEAESLGDEALAGRLDAWRAAQSAAVAEQPTDAARP